MPTDTALIEKREELKRRLAAGEYKTLVDIFLEWFDRLIRKITRRSEPLPIWQTTVGLILAVTLIVYAAVYVADDLAIFQDLIELMGLDFGLGISLSISILVFYITSIVVINQYIARIFVLWRDMILDSTESVTSLEEFESWLERTGNWRWNLLTAIIVGLLFSTYYVAISSIRLGVFAGYSFTFGTFVSGILGGVFIYLFWMVVLLSAKLRRYDLKLFPVDPASSELISRLSSVFGSIVYFVAVIASYLTLVAVSSGAFLTLGIILLIVWLPIIAMFILNQTSLSSIIRRAKWKTLNGIQEKVEKLQIVENFEDKETIEAINRLMDYHDRVKATRNSAIDLGTTLNFINSLLLPIIAFILGNLELVVNLFRKQP